MKVRAFFFVMILFLELLCHVGITFGEVQYVSGATTAGNNGAKVITLIDDTSTPGSDTNPFVVFIPVRSRGNPNAGGTFIKDNPDIPDIQSAALTVNNPFVALSFTHNEGSSIDPRHLVLAVQSTTNFKVIVRSLINLAPGTVQSLSLRFLEDICQNSPCTKLGTQITDNTDFKEEKLIAAWAVDPADTESDIGGKDWTVEELTTNKKAIFIRLKFSSKIDNTNTPLIESIEKGDTLLPITFNRGSTDTSVFPLNEIHKVVIVNYKNNVAQGAQKITAAQAVVGTELTEVDPSEGGVVKLFDLENDEDFEIGIAFKSKYSFYSLVSPSKLGQTRAIETFLEQQSCYLISAGFQREHFVLDFFRQFRDEVLLKNGMGRWFVQFYYNHSLAYAKYVYGSPFISFMVRMLAYMLYFIILPLRSFYGVPFFMLLTFAILYLFRRTRFIGWPNQ